MKRANATTQASAHQPAISIGLGRHKATRKLNVSGDGPSFGEFIEFVTPAERIS